MAKKQSALTVDAPMIPTPSPSPAEQGRIAEAKTWRSERIKERGLPPTIKGEVKGPKHVAIGQPHSDGEGWGARLNQALGSASFDFMDMALTQLANGVGASAEDNEAAINQGLAFIAGLQPQNELEAALAIQAYATHAAAMEMTGRMRRADTIDKLNIYGSLATKLTRTFVAQSEAFAKIRSGGKQQVEVRYVYVDARGGQNVIGSQIVPGRGGAFLPSPDQSHAPISCAAIAPGLPLPGPDPERNALPVAGGEGKGSLSDARREEPGRAEGRGERALSDGCAHAGDGGSAEAGAGPGEPLPGAAQLKVA